MSELKPCPCCNGISWVDYRAFTTYVYCDKCGLRTKAYNTEAEAIEAWNTRHERTCRNEFDRCFAFECSECGVNVEGGDMLGHNSSEGAFNFCPNCGAKVVDE